MGLCLPRTFTGTAEEESQNLHFARGAEFHAHLGRMFVFRGGHCPCFQSKRLCEHTRWGASGESGPSHLSFRGRGPSLWL